MLASMDRPEGSRPKPTNIERALATFDEVYSPRIVGRMNDYDVKIGHARGDHVWHVHAGTDEFFLLVDGTLNISMRDAAGVEMAVSLGRWDTFIVPRGVEHKPDSPAGCSFLVFEPSGTSSTGDQHEGELPDYVDATTGHQLD
jgi:mannose-6-phosphate isomerase-like protein (cupin superfamily)